MLSGKSQSGTAPYAMGSLLQAATYGATIPVIYGTTMSPLLAIWAANLRQGGSTKKFKQLKKGITAYCENIDFLLGHNLILGVLQMWNNGGTIPLNYTSVTFNLSGGLLDTFPLSFNIGASDAFFYAVVGVTLAKTYSVTFDDYGGQGPQTLAGTYNIPLWNNLHAGPDPTGNSGYRNFPYTYRWQPSYGGFVYFDDFKAGTIGDITIHYAQLIAATSFLPPIQKERLTFEASLGEGTEYSDASLSAQQIIYPMYAGLESSSIDLGSGGVIPQLQAEVQGKWGLYPQGDGDFADMIEDIFKSGVAQAAIGAASSTTPGFTQLEHGLSGYDYPGCIQFKGETDVEEFTQAPITYNQSVTKGNFLVVIGFTGGVGGVTPSISDSAGNSWTSVVNGTKYNVWWAQANATGPVKVTVTGQGFDWGTTLIRLDSHSKRGNRRSLYSD
jgi:hypothetical protein